VQVVGDAGDLGAVIEDDEVVPVLDQNAAGLLLNRR